MRPGSLPPTKEKRRRSTITTITVNERRGGVIFAIYLIKKKGVEKTSGHHEHVSDRRGRKGKRERREAYVPLVEEREI